MIELRKISAGYRGEPVLRDVDLVFPAGCVTVLLGPNGCGKSTLLKTALGLLPALSGEVLYDGAPLSGMPPEQVARRAAYMAQSRNVPSIEAWRMVLHGRFPYLSFPRRYRKSDYAAVRRAMEKADALELADRPMQELSGGQRQKVYLAMALAQETPAVFMDEPTTFLDVRHQMDVMRTARGLADGGKAVVLVSHDLCQALRTADRVALLADGRLCMAGTPEQVYAGGALDRVFGVRVRRVPVDGGWQYFCEWTGQARAGRPVSPPEFVVMGAQCMAYFPMFVELEGRPCLIVGGGAVALRKARRLLPYGPCLTVVAQSFVPELEALEGAALCRRAFRPRDVEGQALVVAATGDGALNREIAALCRARRIPVNAVDDKDNCTFLFPALVRRGPLSIGISTGGDSPTAAVYVKEKIEAALPGGDGWNGILEYLAARRAPVRASVPDETARARLFAALFDACMEKGRPLEQAEFDALAARMEREGPGNA